MTSRRRLALAGTVALGLVLLGFPMVEGRHAEAAPRRDPIAVQWQDPESFLSLRTKAHRVIRRGATSRFRSRRVEIGHDAMEPLGTIAQSAFKSQSDFLQRVRSIRPGRGVLRGAPISRAETFEFDDAFLLVQCTSITVAKPAALAKVSPEFKTFLAKQRTGAVDLANLTPESRAGLQDLIQKELPGRRADDPLKVAALEGEQAVLDAIVAGKGLFEITDEIVVPKRLPPMVNGVPQLPAFENGVFNHRAYLPIDAAYLRAIRPRGITRRLPTVEIPVPEDTLPDEDDPVRRMASIRRGMLVPFEAKFMTGFTLSSNWEWSRTWRFESGLFRAQLGAGYAVGLRFPIRVQGQVDANRITVTGSQDVGTSFHTTLTAEPFDADADFFAEVGVNEPDATRGKELALYFGFGYGYKVRALYMTLRHRSYRIRYELDFSKDINPPFADDDSRGLAIWIPPSLTNTEFDWVVLRGWLKAGLRISGTGTVKLDYESFHGDATRRRTLTFRDLQPLKRTTTLPALVPEGGESTASESYGFKLSNPVYRIQPTITPGVQVSVRIGYRGFKRTISTGALWIRALEMPILPASFSRHAGTTTKFEWREGQKTFRTRTR